MSAGEKGMTVEQVAEEVWNRCTHEDPECGPCVDCITSALRSCASQARAEALEEAAKVSEENICGLDICSTATAEKIRSLPGGPR